MTAETAGRYQDGSYLAAHPTWHEEDSAWKAQHLISLLKRNDVAPATVAEVGCGAGRVLAAVASAFGARGTGYEISPDAYALCSRLSRDGLEFRLENALESDATYDLLLLIDVFEHVEDYIGFIRSLRRMGRRTAFHIPLEMNALTSVRRSKIKYAREKSGHLHHFTKDTAVWTLESAGYRVIDYAFTHGGLAFGRGLEAAALKLPRLLLNRVSEDLSARLFGGCSLAVLAE